MCFVERPEIPDNTKQLVPENEMLLQSQPKLVVGTATRPALAPWNQVGPGGGWHVLF